MQKTRCLRVFALTTCVAVIGHADAQVTLESNNPPLGSFVGHVGTNINPVEVRHNGNFPIEWYTDSIQRMQLYPIGNSTINGFGLIDQTGFVGISARPDFFTGTVGPFSRLHLVDDVGTNVPLTYAQPIDFRPWQRNGITLTGNGRPEIH